jgi:hypothetical protein
LTRQINITEKNNCRDENGTNKKTIEALNVSLQVKGVDFGLRGLRILFFAGWLKTYLFCYSKLEYQVIK